MATWKHLIASTNLDLKAILELIKNKEKRPNFSDVCPVCVCVLKQFKRTHKRVRFYQYLFMYVF